MELSKSAPTTGDTVLKSTPLASIADGARLIGD
jgi:hypothetical protein